MNDMKAKLNAICKFAERALIDINGSRKTDFDNDIYVSIGASNDDFKSASFLESIGYVKDRNAANDLFEKIKLALILCNAKDMFDLSMSFSIDVLCLIELRYK